ncbi:hypothetical protein A9Q83_18375 [Alphaproteobacteria bacterium 46_93_T64]|nr:hypothetical protein A9Q83_18375 [Alphaproteobacteria bacterium 46_93_T64]
MSLTPQTETSILEQIEEFAEIHIAPKRHELITSHQFPKNLWAAFGKSGLSGLTTPTTYGGLGVNYGTLSKAAYLINKIGGVPGVTMVLMSHWLLAKLHISNNASDAVKHDLLPSIVSGNTTLAVAISEPGAGAHPKFLKTTAERSDNNFILNGEKTFLTNAPLADYFIVLAITSQTETRKEFSAILVPAESIGLERTDGIKLDFLHPCPHGGILLKDCTVPTKNLIGVEGQAFEQTSLQMRALEDAVGASALVGGMERLLGDLADKVDSEASQKTGEVITQLQTLKVTALHLATYAEASDNNLEDLMSLQLGFRQQSIRCMQTLEELSELSRGQLQPETTLLARDISKLHAIAKTAQEARLTKIGQAYLSS